MTRARGPVLSRSILLRLAALTPATLLVHGYHPFADDAGIYVAGIRKLLDPALYQIDAPFVLANTHLSIFAHIFAGEVRVTHVPLAWALLAAHLASIFLYLLAGWLVARAVFARRAEHRSAVVFAAACFTLPAAGTALLVMDPYITSRSFSTPLGLFAVAAALERHWGWAAVLVVLMGLMHPLMAAYAAALLVFYYLVDSGRPRAAAALAAAGVAAFGITSLALRHVPVSPAYYKAIHSNVRTFLFPSLWTWYEDAGLIAPLALFTVAAFRSKREGRIRKLCFASVLLGLSATLAAFLFVHTSGPFLLARVQLLRSFHILYVLGTLLLGGWLGGLLWQGGKRRLLFLVLLAAAAGGLFAAQRATYPESAHIEWPGSQPRNPWAQAYDWVRDNTPADAVFAADPELVFLPGVDSQGFRATTGRSILADEKDRGVAAIVDPSIASEWAAQYDAQAGVDTMSDAERERRLRPFGVTWLLLRADSATKFGCPYRNVVAKVCRMGR
jgi:MFS family permease